MQCYVSASNRNVFSLFLKVVCILQCVYGPQTARQTIRGSGETAVSVTCEDQLWRLWNDKDGPQQQTSQH